MKAFGRCGWYLQSVDFKPGYSLSCGWAVSTQLEALRAKTEIDSTWSEELVGFLVRLSVCLLNSPLNLGDPMMCAPPPRSDVEVYVLSVMAFGFWELWEVIRS